MFPFQKLMADGKESQPHIGDRLVYDERNGTLFVHRESADMQFLQQDTGEAVARLFIGKGWSRDLTKASAELYARLGGLRGNIHAIDGSFPTLQVYEVVG